MRLLRPLLVLLTLVVALPAYAADGDSRFVGMDDFLIHAKSWGNPSDPAIILIHGFTLNMTFWDRQIPALAKDHYVVALDSPGHGQSGRPRDLDYTMDLYARAVEAVAREAGVSHAVLVGHSMGLPVIHTIVRRGVLKVDKAVFLDGAIVAPPADAKARAEQDKFFAEMRQGLRSPDYRLVLEQFLKGLMPKLSAADTKTVLNNLKDADQRMVSSTFDHFTDANVWAPLKSKVPVLALYAKMSEPGVKQWLNAHYPNNTLKVWDDVDHFPQLEQPARINQAILDFVK